MSRHLNISLVAFILFAGTFVLPAQKYIPFPYVHEKVATGDSAMVVTAHPLATKIGVEILQKGGNAVDAAVAIQFALAVVYPQAGNIGGGGFAIYRDKEGKVYALDYREKAPAAAYEKMYLDSTGEVIKDKSRLGVLAAGVPGTVDGMWELHQRYGKLPWKDLFPATIEFAEKGFQLTQKEAEALNAERFNFLHNSPLIPAFVSQQSWEFRDWLIQKDLAQTLKKIAEEGRDGFYKGGIPALVVNTMKKKNGMITEQDMADYHSVWRTPLEFDYKKMHIITMPPPSSGGIILKQLLGMTGQYDLKSKGFHTVEAVHLMVEAERRAYADRAEHMGDPDFWKVPVNEITSQNYLKGRMKDFNANKATPSSAISAGQVKESEETTHYCVVDAEGNAISITTTLNDSYGSRAVVAGAGFILNNEMDDFSVKPGAPNIYGAVGGKANAIVPNKRPLSSMTPTIITKKNKVWMVLGSPGGTTIPTSVFQTIVNVAEFGLSLPDALKAGRFHHQWLPDQISIEENALPEEVLNSLKSMGHEIHPRSPIGRVEAIIRLPDGNWQGAADTRGNDAAKGY
ncbi:MAG: gamma-glutamyltransferase [Bacteroidetes bacterium]|nr:gamma-glutamyltransferase [Bacteroidota bacterium]